MSDANKASNTKLYIASVGSGVTATGDYRLSNFEGEAALNFGVESDALYGQEFWIQEYAVTRLNLGLDFGGVWWNTDKFVSILMGVTAAAGSMLDDAAANATVWSVTNSLETIPAKEALIWTVRSSDSKDFMIKGYKSRLSTDFSVGLGKEGFMTGDLGMALFPATGGTVVEFYEEQ